MAGTLLRFTGATRGLRISWLTVGINPRVLHTLYLKPVRAKAGIPKPERPLDSLLNIEFNRNCQASSGSMLESLISIRKFGQRTEEHGLARTKAEEALPPHACRN